jgi:hypothetical protein
MSTFKSPKTKIAFAIYDGIFLHVRASPQLECWNIGIKGYGIVDCWVNGKIVLDDEIKNG